MGCSLHDGRIEIDYRQALYLGDNVEIFTQIERVGNTSVTLAQKIAKSEASMRQQRRE